MKAQSVRIMGGVAALVGIALIMGMLSSSPRVRGQGNDGEGNNSQGSINNDEQSLIQIGFRSLPSL
jgi:hypothetical protein